MPWPQDLVNEEWANTEEAEKIVQFLKAGKVIARYRGFSRCRICGKSNGSYDLTDGKFIWPSGFAHYIEEHGVKPDGIFLIHVKRVL